MAIRCGKTTSSPDGSVETETRYYVSSLDTFCFIPRQIAKFIRGHWQVENSLHWLKDRYWREDKHKLRKPGLGMVYASLTNLAVSVLQLLPGKSIIEKSDACCYQPKKQLKKSGSDDFAGDVVFCPAILYNAMNAVQRKTSGYLMEVPFIHLHVHSHYSLLDGAGEVGRLVQRAKELEMPALALTDHGNLFGALEFYRTAKEQGIKPIIGYEAYLATGHRTDKSAKTQKEACSHLTLLAMNRTGYKNLLKLASIAELEGKYYKPRIDKEILAQYNEGLLCLSGCASSEMSRILLDQNDPDRFSRAKKLANWYRNLFGDRYYLEIQDNGLEIQKTILEGTVKLAAELNIPTAATNDVHYVYQKESEAQDILLCVNTRAKRSDEKRMRMDSDQFYFRSGAEMKRAMPDQEEAIQRTVEIAGRVDIELEKNPRYFPVFTPPKGLSSEDYLRQLCIEGLKRRYADNPKRCKNGQLSEEVLARLERELSIIFQLGFPNYFLVVWDFVRVAEERGIHRTARGSGVGALVCYALNMSHVCPLEFDLLFERFLDLSRKEAPDIDIDFDQDRRGEIIDYVKEKYGESNVAQLGTFGTMAAKQSIKDVGRVLDLSIPFVNEITQLVPDAPKITIDKALAESEELNKRYENEPVISELINYAKQIEGLARNTGVHACGVIIADKPLSEYVPLQLDKNEGIVTQWQGVDVEKAGLLKMDFLGLRNLTILAHAIELIKETTGKTIDPYQLPLDDKESYELLCRGETKGIFQLEGGGIRELLTRMKPDNFRDIIATLALYRPGPLEGGMVDQYVAVKHGKKKAVYDHPICEEILSETYGVMVYQEQIMRILNRLGNIPLGDAYACIKAISKKKDFSKYRDAFVAGSKENGLATEKADAIFDLIVAFAGYGFNKSHSTAYAMVAYITAYLKSHYPVEFMAALLCGDISGRNFSKKDDTVEHIADCRRMGIEVIPPDVNISKQRYSVVDGKIMFALTAIKSCGDWAADKIIEARQKGGRFTSLFDFCERLGGDNKACNRATIETLIKAGAFDSLGISRAQLFHSVEAAMKSGQTAAANTARGQTSLFGGDDDDTAGVQTVFTRSSVSEWSEKEQSNYEKEVLGFYLTSHPLQEFADVFEIFRTHECSSAGGLKTESPVVLAGIVNNIKLGQGKKPKPGKPNTFAMFDLEDASGAIRSIMWSEAYAEFGTFIKNEQAVFMRGKIDRSRSQDAESNDGNFIVDEIFSIEEAPQKLCKGVTISLDETQHSADSVRTLNDMLRESPGKGTVELALRLKNGSHVTFSGSRITAEITPVLYRKMTDFLGGYAVKILRTEPAQKKWR
jgi:DNA polymerase-3 subunit alpha